MRAACDHKGCAYVAEHPTKYVFAMLGNHKRRAHGVIGRTAKYRQPKQDTSQPDEVEKQRPYVRKPSPVSGLNFCPCCGTSLRAIRIAISL